VRVACERHTRASVCPKGANGSLLILYHPFSGLGGVLNESAVSCRAAREKCLMNDETSHSPWGFAVEETKKRFETNWLLGLVNNKRSLLFLLFCPRHTTKRMVCKGAKFGGWDEFGMDGLDGWMAGWNLIVDPWTWTGD
jgi:hypothetical protein